MIINATKPATFDSFGYTLLQLQHHTLPVYQALLFAGKRRIYENIFKYTPLCINHTNLHYSCITFPHCAVSKHTVKRSPEIQSFALSRLMLVC